MAPSSPWQIFGPAESSSAVGPRESPRPHHPLWLDLGRWQQSAPADVEKIGKCDDDGHENIHNV